MSTPTVKKLKLVTGDGNKLEVDNVPVDLAIDLIRHNLTVSELEELITKLSLQLEEKL